MPAGLSAPAGAAALLPESQFQESQTRSRPLCLRPLDGLKEEGRKREGSAVPCPPSSGKVVGRKSVRVTPRRDGSTLECGSLGLLLSPPLLLVVQLRARQRLFCT